MRTVFKYVFDQWRDTTFDMPVGAMILTVQVQNDALVMWALLDTDDVAVKRSFVVLMTGQRIRPFLEKYIGTVQDKEGFVWHIFEVIL